MPHNIYKILIVSLIMACEEPKPDPVPTTSTVRKESKLSNLKAPDGFDCEPDRAIARNLAGECWEEQSKGCVKGKERKKGECPTCDALDKKQEAMLKDGCLKTQEEIDMEDKQ